MKVLYRVSLCCWSVRLDAMQYHYFVLSTFMVCPLLWLQNASNAPRKCCIPSKSYEKRMTYGIINSREHTISTGPRRKKTHKPKTSRIVNSAKYTTESRCCIQHLMVLQRKNQALVSHGKKHSGLNSILNWMHLNFWITPCLFFNICVFYDQSWHDLNSECINPCRHGVSLASLIYTLILVQNKGAEPYGQRYIKLINNYQNI